MSFKQVASELLHRLPNSDHRVIGLRQKLFFFDERSKGSCFFKPRGAHIYNKLVDYLRQELKRRHYEEVVTPNIYSCELWKQSGHWHHYKDNMIRFPLSENEYSLKPMNCPGHCLMYQELGRVTSAQLPIRWADFGVLHRNETSGALMGLARVRRFQQDDAHIFCTPEQVSQEVGDCLDFARHVYTDFGFQDFKLFLSLRPEKFMGDEGLWDQAEGSLREALKRTELAWTEQEFEGAFYGPKIDLVVKDTQARSHQCATIQLDFQLPTRFDLTYKDLSDDEAPKRPVMIHRAILGSIERFIAMMAENSKGRWPFWLSPVQVHVVPLSGEQNGYAQSVVDTLNKAGFWADCPLNTSVTFNKKIRDAVIVKYNFIVIVGNKEVSTNTVTVRVDLDGKKHQVTVSVDKLLELFAELRDKRVREAEREFLDMSSGLD